MQELIRQFQEFFDIVPACNGDLLRQSLELRYRVYCLEKGYEDPRNYPEGLEKDEYDVRSVHTILRHRSTGVVTGTVRLVLANSENESEYFPTEALGVLRRNGRDDMWRVPRRRLGEISRFAVSKVFRRRLGEEQTSHGITDLRVGRDGAKGARYCPYVSLGLIKSVFHMSWENDITHWYASMEPGLIRLLRQLGIEFTPIGPLVNYHGLRQPCIGEVAKIFEGINNRQPLVGDFIAENGKWTCGEYAQKQVEREIV